MQRKLEELGDWQATFPGRNAEMVLAIMRDLDAYRDVLADIDKAFGCDHVKHGPDCARVLVRHVRELQEENQRLRTLMRSAEYALGLELKEDRS